MLSGLCFSLSSLITSSDSKAFLHFIVFSGSPLYHAFLFFDAKAYGHSHKLTSSCIYTTVLHCEHTFLRHIDPLHSIACTTVLHCGYTYLSDPLIKDSHKRLSLMGNIACSKSRDHTLPLRTCYGEVYGNIARRENG